MGLNLIPLLLTFFSTTAAVYAAVTPHIGVNYGTVANNLPPPQQVINFIKTQTNINHIKIFDTNPQILTALSNITGISLTVTIPNSEIPSLSNLQNAKSWLSNNILPYLPETSIRYIAVGNEIIATSDKTLISHLLPAMESITSALHLANITGISVSTPHSLGILSGSSEPPSSGRFRKGFEKSIFTPILDFHNRTKSPFMINPYPFFGVRPGNLNYALFNTNDVVFNYNTNGVVFDYNTNDVVFDPVTKLNYTNMFDAMLDAVYSAMNRVGYGNVEIVVTETGWSSAGELNQTGLNYAATYNRNLIKHVNSGKGTPLMPNRVFKTFIFSLFNENLKSSISEQNYGLFKPDLTPVYDVGIMKTSQKWCVPRLEASDEALQKNIDYVCSKEVNCGPIESGGVCFSPDSVRSHAAYSMNMYYHTFGMFDFNCDFNGTGLITTVDPSYGTCSYTL